MLVFYYFQILGINILSLNVYLNNIYIIVKDNKNNNMVINMKDISISEIRDSITNKLGANDIVTIKEFIIGNQNPLNAILFYINSLVNVNLINENILIPLMLHVNEDLHANSEVLDIISKKYIPLGNTIVESGTSNAISFLNHGNAVIYFEGIEGFICANVSGGNFRSIEEVMNETSIRGSREGFIEDINTNINILKRIIKDENLYIEWFEIGRRSKTEVAILYINDIVEKNLLSEVKQRINKIDVDSISESGMLEQYIEDSTFSIFPQLSGTERPDRVKASLMEGHVCIMVNGTPYVVMAPGIFVEFFYAVEDYYERTIVSSFTRLLRILAVFIVVTVPSIYLSLLNYNPELIPIKFIIPIAQSRQGIPLTPFLEILFMEIIVELLREGGLRLPPKISQTLSIVGGIIIGDAAISSKVVSPSTLLVIGVSVVSSFLIPNYDMSLSIRFIRFPMLFIADALGFLGIAAGYFILLVHLFSLKSFGTPYFSINKNDLKDMFTRSPLWAMKKNSEAIPNNNPVRNNRPRKNSGGENE